MWFTEARSPRGWQSGRLSSGDVVEHDRTSLTFLSQGAWLRFPKSVWCMKDFHKRTPVENPQHHHMFLVFLYLDFIKKQHGLIDRTA